MMDYGAFDVVRVCCCVLCLSFISYFSCWIFRWRLTLSSVSCVFFVTRSFLRGCVRILTRIHPKNVHVHQHYSTMPPLTHPPRPPPLPPWRLSVRACLVAVENIINELTHTTCLPISCHNDDA
ncbi:unnamed protein product [Pylaiella littoralis]